MNVRLRRWPIALVVVWALWPVSQSEADMKRDDLRPERVGSDAAWHNLEALAERQRADWPAIGPTETCFIRDELAGAMILKVTAHPGSDHLQYYDVPLWNADGSMMLIRSRTESRRFCLANGDGSHLRPSIVTDTRAFACWDPVHIGFVYHLTQGDERALTRLKVRTGEDEVVADLGHLEHQMRQAPLSPDGKHALLHAPPGEQYPCLLVSTAQGSVETVPAPLPVLRVRFSKAPDYSIFLNSGSGVERTTGFVQVPSGEFRPIHRGYASHPDMSPDGKLLSVFIHADDGVSRDWVLMDRTGTVVGRIPRMMGHQSWSPCGRFCVADGYAGASASGSQLDGGRVHGAIALIDPFSLTVWNLNRHMS